MSLSHSSHAKLLEKEKIIYVPNGKLRGKIHRKLSISALLKIDSICLYKH